MQGLVSGGLAAAQAARLVLSGGEPARPTFPSATTLEDATGDLTASLDRLDEQAANAALDRLFATYTVETVLQEVILPYLHSLGERWEAGEVSVAQEHFASNLIRGRLLGLAQGWGQGQGPAPSWPAYRASSMNSACWCSGSPCTAAAGGSPTSAPTARSAPSPTSPGRRPRGRRPPGHDRGGVSRPGRRDRAARQAGQGRDRRQGRNPRGRPADADACTGSTQCALPRPSTMTIRPAG